MSVNYTISGGGTIMTFDDGTTEITQADVQTYPSMGDITTIVIPTSVVDICGTYAGIVEDPPFSYFATDGAFSSLPNLTTITFNTPSSLKVIGPGAFYGDYGITSLTLPSGLEYIGDYAINVSSGSPTINTVPSSVTYIGESAFQSYATFTSLTTLPSAITGISQSAFAFVTISTTLTIPSNVITIGINTFGTGIFNGGSVSNCGLILVKGLKTISISAFNSATFSGNRTLIIPPSTQTIGDDAFKFSNLTNITYTSTTTLGSSPFPGGVTLTILPGPNPPTDLSGTWNPSSIDLLWTAPTQTGATPVAYYLITDTGSATVYQTPNSNTNYTVTGTDPVVSYTFTIQTVNEDEATSAASVSILVGPSNPNPPTDLSGIWNPSSIDLLWTAPTQTGTAPIAYYLITDTDNTTIYQTPDSNTNYTIPGTDPATVNQNTDTSVPSASIRVGRPPDPPTNLSATPSYGSLTLNWTAPAQAGAGTIANYNIINKSTLVSITTPDTTPSYTISGLSGGILYTYVIQTVTDIATSTDSSDVSGIPLSSEPFPPTNLSGIWNPTDVVLSWTAPTQTGTAPIDYYLITNTITSTVIQTPDSTPTYTISHPTTVNYYIYTIQTVNQNSAISEASDPLTIGVDTPEPPSNIVATGGYYVVNLTWSAPSYSGTSDISYYIITDVNSFATYNTTNTVYNVPGTVGTSYTYTVKAVNQGSYISDASGSVSGTPNDTLYTISDGGLTMTFNNGVTEITQAIVQSYGGYTSLETVVIPTSVVTICGTFFDDSTSTTDGAFSGILGLRTFTINTPSSLQVIGIGAFLNNSIASLTLPSGLQSIGERAFYNGYVFPVITMIVNTIPSTVTYIGSEAFNSPAINFSIFANLVTFSPQLTQILEASFYQATFNGGSVSSCGLILVKGLKTISTSAFQNGIFSGNLSLTIPPSTTFIADYAFFNSNLTNITYTSTTTLGTTPFPVGATLTILTGPNPPTDFSGTPTPSSIDLSWTTPTQTGATPVAYYLITDTGSSTVYQTPNSTTNYTISGTDPNESYTYIIQTVNQDDATSAASTSILVGQYNPDAPTDLSGIWSSSSIQLFWIAPIETGITPIAYYLITDTDNTTIYQTPNTDTNYTIPGINPTIIYTYTIQTVNQSGGTSTPSASISLGPPPDPPTNLSTTPSYGSLTLNWTAPTYIGTGTISNYNIINKSTLVSITTPNATPSYTITDLSGGILYTYVLQTVTNNGVSIDSSDVSGIPLYPNPDPPTNIVVTPYYGGLILILTWTAPIQTGGGTITNYKITNTSTLVATITPNASTGYSFNDLSAGVVYTYFIQTITDRGISIDSSDVSGIPLWPDLTPTNINVRNQVLSLYLTWGTITALPPGTTDVQYIIEDLDNGTIYLVPDVPATDPSPAYVITDMVPDIIYSYRIKTYVQGYTSPSSTIVNGIPQALRYPLDMETTGGINAVFINWYSYNPPDASGDPILYTLTNITTSTTYTTYNTYYDVTNLTPYVTYSFKIKASVYGQTSEDSYIFTGTPISLPPDSPTDFSGIGISPISIYLFWTPLVDTQDISAYVITNVTSATTINVAPPNASTTISGLQVDEEYAFYIRIEDIYGNFSSPSSTIYVSTTPRIKTTVTINGTFKQYLLPMTQSFPLQVVTNPPGVNTIGPIYIDQYNVSSTALPIFRSMESSQFYTVYAYIDPNDPIYDGSNSPFYTLELLPFLPEPLNCSPALELNALSKGGNFSSAITIALGKQMNNTTIAAKVFTQTSAPVCCSTSPSISPFSGGTTSGTQTLALIQNQALCTYNQNLAVAKLRQIPGCPIDNAQRFAKYQRFPSAEANCTPPVIVTGLPTAVNGPCTNVIGISQTSPYT